ncbi:hypothetical protein ACFV7Q_30955 [Streptomyces sp. NPDC059851]|uniref:hypothetical protein n=1 Tax=Streptomyces sp. NPDC059851 TaxID=3346971 RepID=UPI003668F328
MEPVTLACAVVPVTALLYGQLGLLHRRRERWYRVTAEHCAEVMRDPYRATAGRWWSDDDTQAAAARLLLDGLVTVNHRGNLSLTAAGADPARAAGHPLPDALLAALRRRTAPATLGNVTLRDTGFRTVREEFHAAGRARVEHRVPELARAAGRPARAGNWSAALVMVFTAAALAGLPSPRGAVEWAAAAVTAVGLVAQIAWFSLHERLRTGYARRDPWADRAAGLDVHPALVELARLDPEATERLRVSRLRTRRGRNRGRPRHRRAPAEAEAEAGAGARA